MKKIFIISGFSGSGKGTLVNKVMEKRSDIKVVKSYTTRPKRSEDDFYNFVSGAEFDEFKEEIDKIIRKLESSEVLCSRESSD